MRIETIYSLYSGIREQTNRFEEHASQIASGSFDINALIGLKKCERSVEISAAVMRRADQLAEEFLEDF